MVSDLFGNVQRDLQILIDLHLEGTPGVELDGWRAQTQWHKQLSGDVFCVKYDIMLRLGSATKPGVVVDVMVSQYVDTGSVEVHVGQTKSCEDAPLEDLRLLAPAIGGLASRVQEYVQFNRLYVPGLETNSHLITEESYKGLPSNQSATASASDVAPPVVA